MKYNKKLEENLRKVYGQGFVITFYEKKKAVKNRKKKDINLIIFRHFCNVIVTLALFLILVVNIGQVNL